MDYFVNFRTSLNCFFIIVSMGFTTITNAKELLITVKEKGTGEPVSGATVVLIENTISSDDIVYEQTNDWLLKNFLSMFDY